MDIKDILSDFKNGKLSIEEVQKLLTLTYIEKLEDGIANLDINRNLRKEIPEIIYAEGKEYSDICKIGLKILDQKNYVLISRTKIKDLSKLKYFFRKKKFVVEIGRNSSTILVSKDNVSVKPYNKIGIICAGTSDIGIAEEARLVSKAMGCDSVLWYDIGIAAIHRIFPALKTMLKENVSSIVVVAGMEGALPSFIASCIDIPIIGVPSSIGYGYGAGGVAALSTMLQSCTLGLTVVNIDNGIGAGAFAALIAKKRDSSHF